MLYGRTSAALPSRFLKEIPEEYLERKGGFRKVESTGYHASNGYSGYGSYAPVMRETQKPSELRAFAPKSESGACPEFNKGDMVSHAAFGRGMVLSVLKMGGDALLEIAFDDIGTKKLMAKTASTHMKKLS